MTWEQLSAIVNTDREQRATNATLQPVLCPNDATPLDVGPQGEIHCPFDGWIWNGEPVDP